MNASLSIDLLWLLICAALVFFMQAGFACLESGLTRRKNSINVALKKIAGFSITGMTFWFFGFAMVFGPYTWHGFIGWADYQFSADQVNLIATYIFELMFAGCAITIISGAIAERVKFSGYLIMVMVMASLVYPFVGHWVWNSTISTNPGGWLSNLGFMDFAGSTVVHSSGGWAALACAIVLGPRLGRFGNNGKPVEISGNDVPLSILGALILWVGWLGFNGGSGLTFFERVPTILLCTMLAPIFGLFSALAIDWYRKGYARVDAAINGALGGLVAITAGSNVLNPSAAIYVGLIAGVIVLWSEEFLLRAKWDDAVGAFPVHGACGVFGTLAVALFGDPQFFEGRSVLHQLGVQLLGAVCVFLWTMSVMYLVLKFIDKFIFKLRVSPTDEISGLNIVEHHATTEILDLFYAMEKQAATGDLSIRLHEEQFTEAGQIANRYNKVLDRVNMEMEIANRMTKIADLARQEAEESSNKLDEKVKELQQFNRISVGREIKMIELKKEINELCKQLGRPPKFNMSELEESNNQNPKEL
jgi:Amt family ammonium transporter